MGYVAVTTMVFNDITLDLTTGDAFEYIFEAFLGMDYDSGTQTLTLDEDFFPPSLSEEGKEEHLMKKKYCKCFKMEKTKKK